MSFASAFHNDPFFAGFEFPRASAAPALEHRSHHDRQISQRPSNDDQRMDMFGNPFALMQTMMNNMGQMMSQMETRMNSNDFTGRNGHGVSFSSSTMMSMDRSNDQQQPRIVQATSERLHGPEGFERTRKAVRDTGRNIEKMEVAHRIGERGHRITKERDPSTGRLLENRQFEHVENEQEFEREWFDRAEKYGLKSLNRNGFDAQTNNLLTAPPSSFEGRRRSQSQEPRHLAIEHGSSAKNPSRHQERRRN